MSDVMKTYRKPDGYTIQATPKAFQLFYKKQGFVPVEDKENTGSGELPVKAEADRQEEPKGNTEENISAEALEENISAEALEENTSVEPPEEKSGGSEEVKPSTNRRRTAKRDSAEKDTDSVSEQPAG